MYSNETSTVRCGLTASSNCFPVLFLLEVTLAGVGDGDGEGEGDKDGDGGRGCVGETGEGGGRGAFSSSSISFSNFMSPGGSTLYLEHKNRSLYLGTWEKNQMLEVMLA